MERRTITWRKLLTRHFLWAPPVVLLVALMLALFAWQSLATADRLAVYGTDAMGVVTGREIVTRRDGDGAESTEYHVHYRFEPATGPAVSDQASVSRTTWDRLAPGDEIAVRYVLHDPATNEIEPGSTLAEGRILALLAAGAAVLGSALTVWLGGRKLSLVRAARQGEVREARVTAIERTNTQVNGRTQYRLRWLDAVGAEGRSGMFGLESLPAPGAVIVVYIDPRTGRGWWEEEF